MSPTTIAIVGAGFSGAMLAAHLLRGRPSRPTRVLLFDRTGKFGRGVAYGTAEDTHLLNVPAGQMSALDDDPSHFLRYLEARDPSATWSTFAPRRVYGEYLEATLAEAEANPAEGVTFSRVRGEVIDVVPKDTGLDVVLAGSSAFEADRVEVDRVVLAIGHSAPSLPGRTALPASAAARYVPDPWAALDVPADEPVLLVGTGLTMVDVALALTRRGHRGTIYAVSRHGLLPRPHVEALVRPGALPPPEDLATWPHTARGLVSAFRAAVEAKAAAGVDWRDVLGSIRSDVPALWRGLDLTERRRLLRHVRSYWDVHRHRMPPTAAASIDALVARGQLVVLAGAIAGIDAQADALGVYVRRRGEPEPLCLSVARIVNCTGPTSDVGRIPDRLVRSLHARGLIRADPLALGIDTDDSGAPIDRDGRADDRIVVAGPLRKASLWEHLAVPELRLEAATLARRLARMPLPRRDLEAEAGAVAPERLRGAAFVYGANGYGRAVLASSAEREIVAIHWRPGTSSVLHGHGDSAAHVRIVSGAIAEERFVPEGRGYRFERGAIGAGSAGTLPVGALHRVITLDEAFAVHAYSPPLEEPAAPPASEIVPKLKAARLRDEPSIERG